MGADSALKDPLWQVQVSIGITTGLFASALLVYMFGNKRKSAQLFAF